MHNPKVKKQLGLYEIENIDNANVGTIAVDPKEYFEKFKDRTVNKKQKGVKRNTKGMDFESYAGTIILLREVDCKKKRENNYSKMTASSQHRNENAERE